MLSEEMLTPGGNEDPLHDLWDLAHVHGLEDDSEHEVGDLQDLSRLCWNMLTPEQREDASRKFHEMMES